jgi:hypothetical protein
MHGFGKTVLRGLIIMDSAVAALNSFYHLEGQMETISKYYHWRL